jgi:hypothetical protein
MKAYNPRVGEVNPVDLVDISVVKHLSDTGFIGKISQTYGLK